MSKEIKMCAIPQTLSQDIIITCEPPGKQLTLNITHADGSADTIKLNHTYNQGQIDWFKEGSALNLIKKQNA